LLCQIRQLADEAELILTKNWQDGKSHHGQYGQNGNYYPNDILNFSFHNVS
jgi:hypothetical protein